MKKVLFGLICCLSFVAYACNRNVAEVDDEFLKYMGSAQIKTEKGDFKGAAEDYVSALKIMPNSPKALVELAELQKRSGDHAAAIENLNKAVLLRGSSEDYLKRADANYAAGKNQDAMQDVEKTLSIDSKIAWAYFIRSEIKKASGDKKGALDDINLAVENSSTDIEFNKAVYYVSKARLEAQIGDKKVALENMDAGLKIMKDLGFVNQEELDKIVNERDAIKKGL